MFDGKMMLRMWRQNFISSIAEPSDVEAKSHPQGNKAKRVGGWGGGGVIIRLFRKDFTFNRNPVMCQCGLVVRRRA